MPFGLVHNNTVCVFPWEKGGNLSLAERYFIGFYDDDLCRALDYTTASWFLFFRWLLNNALPKNLDSLCRLFVVSSARESWKGIFHGSAVCSIPIKSQERKWNNEKKGERNSFLFFLTLSSSCNSSLSFLSLSHRIVTPQSWIESKRPGSAVSAMAIRTEKKGESLISSSS